MWKDAGAKNDQDIDNVEKWCQESWQIPCLHEGKANVLTET